MEKEKKNKRILSSLNYSSRHYRIWLSGFGGLVNGLRSRVYDLVINKYFDMVILLIVIVNTTSMCLDGLLTSQKNIDSVESI